jgi:hypothetical protein
VKIRSRSRTCDLRDEVATSTAAFAPAVGAGEENSAGRTDFRDVDVQALFD